MRFGENEIFSGCNIHIKKGEKVFLLGANGCGKTTLIKNIIGKYEPTSGMLKIGSNIQIGYYDQIQENLSRDKDIFTEIHDEFSYLTNTQVRNALAVFLFRGDDVFKEIANLSGGERARVELTKLMLKPANFLVMDEPTNHLDIESREALEKALSDYNGTMLMVSHDRYFINKLADRIIYMDNRGITNYIGNYDDFMAKKTVTQTVTKITDEKPKNLDYQEQKRLQAEKRKILNRFTKVEELIAELENEVKELNCEMMDPKIAADFTKLNELSQLAECKNEEILELMEEWEQLHTEIEEKGYLD